MASMNLLLDLREEIGERADEDDVLGLQVTEILRYAHTIYHVDIVLEILLEGILTPLGTASGRDLRRGSISWY